MATSYSKAPASQAWPGTPGRGSPRSSVVSVQELVGVVGTSSNAELPGPMASVSGPEEPLAAREVARSMVVLLTTLGGLPELLKPQVSSDSTL